MNMWSDVEGSIEEWAVLTLEAYFENAGNFCQWSLSVFSSASHLSVRKELRGPTISASKYVVSTGNSSVSPLILRYPQRIAFPRFTSCSSTSTSYSDRPLRCTPLNLLPGNRPLPSGSLSTAIGILSTSPLAAPSSQPTRTHCSSTLPDPVSSLHFHDLANFFHTKNSDHPPPNSGSVAPPSAPTPRGPPHSGLPFPRQQGDLNSAVCRHSQGH
mmetsp:Transcript_46964/g.111864  ORF Transcript_46964/g.111864 Transcript_46964/m.111864 type:complete len:214 (-) Transcript_46964:9-650(-)